MIFGLHHMLIVGALAAVAGFMLGSMSNNAIRDFWEGWSEPECCNHNCNQGRDCPRRMNQEKKGCE